MIKRLFALCLLLLSGAAYADYPAVIVYRHQNYQSGAGQESPSTICTKDLYGSSGGWTSAFISGAIAPTKNPVTCMMVSKDFPSGYPIDIYWYRTCPYGGTFNSVATCIGGSGPPPPCSPGSGPNTGFVSAYYASADPGAAIVKKIIPDGGLIGTQACVQGCVVTATGENVSGGQQKLPNGNYKHIVTSGTVSTGASCTASPSNDGSGGEPPPTDANSGTGKCPVGSSPAGQDSSGHTTCKADAPAPSPPKVSESKPPVTTTNPDGSSTTKTETSSTNADGSKTTVIKETTTKSDGTSSTTVTGSTKKPDGTTGKEDKPDSDFCKLNPNLTICKNSQVMGTCGEVSCEGDAIQCATLRAAAAMECRQKDDKKILEESSAYGLGKQVASGTDPMASQLPGPGKASVVTMPSSLDGSGWLGGGALPADKSFTLQGRTVVIPFAKWLAYLVVLRYALMVVALLVSFKILSGAIIRE